MTVPGHEDISKPERQACNLSVMELSASVIGVGVVWCDGTLVRRRRAVRPRSSPIASAELSSRALSHNARLNTLGKIKYVKEKVKSMTVIANKQHKTFLLMVLYVNDLTTTDWLVKVLIIIIIIIIILITIIIERLLPGRCLGWVKIWTCCRV